MQRNILCPEMYFCNRFMILIWFKPRRKYSLADFDKRSLYTTKVFEVKISLPGLNVILNDTQVLENKHDKEIEGNDKSDEKVNMNGVDDKTPLKLTQIQVLEWKCVLHDVEQQVLGDMKDIQWVYYRDECINHYWTNIGAVMGSFIGGVLVLVLIANWRLIRDKIGKRNSGVEEERQPLLSSQSSYQAI